MFFTRFLGLPPFEAELPFDFLVDFFFADVDLDFFLTLTVVVEDFFGDDFFVVGFFFPNDLVASETDLKALIGVPSLISERMVSTVFLTGFLPRAEESPTIAPATPPAMAPMGPATIAPRTAPVMPPAACLETLMSFSG